MTRRIVRRGRRGAGWFVCHRCRDHCPNAEGVEVARPGATKGVWWCGQCAADVIGPDEGETMDGTALPGPHPHESDDIRRNAGDVAKWNDPMEGFRDDAPAETTEADTEPNEAQPQTQG